MTEVRFIAERLQEKMTEHGYTDETLAEKIGMSQTGIYYLRKGRKGRNVTTSAENLRKIADALRTSTEYFVEQDADPSPNQKKMSALVADIAGIAEELSPSRQRELRELGNALLKMEKSTNANLIYSELMDLLTRLTEQKGGESALRELLTHVESLAARPPSSAMPRRAGRRRTNSTTESTEKPTQGDQ